MHRFISVIASLSLAFVAIAQGDQESPAPQKTPPPGIVHSIEVKGNQRYSSAAIIKASSLQIGQHVTAAIVEEARKKLLATELFNNVADDFRYTTGKSPAYDLTIEVTETDLVYPMRFERLNIPADAIKNYLKEHVDLYSDRIPGTKAVLKRYTAAVQEFVDQTNPSMKVKAQVMNESATELSVLFVPDTPMPTISQLLVSGNQALDTGTLLRAINQVAVGAPMTETRINQILDGTIKRLYASKGYMEVTFPKVESEQAKTNLGYIVKVQIKEGPIFQFGAIHFHGTGLDQDEIRSAIPFKPGQTFNGDQVETFRRDLTHRMQRRGFLDVKVDAESQLDDAKHVVDLAYTVLPGAEYTFGSLEIEGLDLHTEPVIQKLWGEKPGKPFNPDYPEFFLARVKEQGLFDNLGDTHSDYAADPASHAVTVHLYFKGGTPKYEKNTNQPGDERDSRPR